MRYGNAAWGLRETPLEKQLAITRDMGVDLLELSIAGYDKDFLQVGAPDAQIAQVRDWFAQYGVKLECACTGNDFTGDDCAEQVAKVKAVIAIAAKLGIKYLRIFAGFSSDSVVIGRRAERMLAALREVNAAAQAAKVVLVVETHGGVAVNADAPACPDGDVLVHFASPTTRVDMWPAILATGVSINYDPANLAAMGDSDPVAFYRKFSANIPYMHLKDFRDVPGGVRPAACGEGRLDWKKLMDAVRDFSGPALIEYELPGDIEDGLKRSLKFLQKTH